jgi:hypothetical protein
VVFLSQWLTVSPLFKEMKTVTAASTSLSEAGANYQSRTSIASSKHRVKTTTLSSLLLKNESCKVEAGGAGRIRERNRETTVAALASADEAIGAAIWNERRDTLF